MSEVNPFEPMSDVPDQDEQPRDPNERDEFKPEPEDEVPSGSIKEVLAWVGDDKDKAKQALDAENEKPSRDRRKGLLRELGDKLS